MNDPGLLKKFDDAIPLGRMAEPEEIARVVAFLAGPPDAVPCGLMGRRSAGSRRATNGKTDTIAQRNAAHFVAIVTLTSKKS